MQSARMLISKSLLLVAISLLIISYKSEALSSLPQTTRYYFQSLQLTPEALEKALLDYPVPQDDLWLAVLSDANLRTLGKEYLSAHANAQRLVTHLESTDGQRGQALTTLRSIAEALSARLDQQLEASVRFEVDEVQGQVRIAPAATDWLLQRRLSHPEARSEFNKAVPWLVKPEQWQYESLLSFGRASVTAPIDIPLTHPLDPDSIKTSGPEQNIFLIKLPEHENMLAPWGPAPLQIKGNWFFQMQKGKISPTLVNAIEASALTLLPDSPVLRISFLKPLTENARYVLIIGSGIQTEEGMPLQMPKDYFQLISSVIGRNQLKNYTKSLHKEASALLASLANQRKLNNISNDANKNLSTIIFTATFSTSAPNRELSALATQSYNASEKTHFSAFTKEQFEVLKPQARPIRIIDKDQSSIDYLIALSRVPKIKDLISKFNIDPKKIQETLTDNKEMIKQVLASLEIGSYGTYYNTHYGLDWGNPSFNAGWIELPQFLGGLNTDEEKKTFEGNEEPIGQTEKNHIIFDHWPTEKEKAIHQKIRMEKIPFLLVLPEGTPPEGGWPLVIFQHGITQDRINAFAPAYALATLCRKELTIDDPSDRPQHCYATIAIDLPLHGIAPEFMVDQRKQPHPLSLLAANQRQLENTAWQGVQERHRNWYRDEDGAFKPMNWQVDHYSGYVGSTFINLNNLLSQRDRLKQAVVDLLNLNASVNNLAQLVEVNPKRLYFIGHSLGGIVGFPAVAMMNKFAHEGVLNPIQGTALLTTGSQVVRILEYAETFRDPLFKAFSSDPSKHQYRPGRADWEAYAYSAQAALDVVDPIVYIPDLNQPENAHMSMLLAQVQGGGLRINGGHYQPDQTIPNHLTQGGRIDEWGHSLPAPLAGTEPLAKLGRLVPMNSLIPDEYRLLQSSWHQESVDYHQHLGRIYSTQNIPARWMLTYNKGEHGSPLVPFDFTRSYYRFQKLVEQQSTWKRDIQKHITTAPQGSTLMTSDSHVFHKDLPLLTEFKQFVREEADLFVDLYQSVVVSFAPKHLPVSFLTGSHWAKPQWQPKQYPEYQFIHLPIHVCHSMPCNMRAQENKGFYHWQDASLQEDLIKGKGEHLGWRFRVNVPGRYRIVLRLPGAQPYRLASNCSRWQILHDQGWSKGVYLNQTRNNFKYRCSQAYPLTKPLQTIDMGVYNFTNTDRIYQLRANNITIADNPDDNQTGNLDGFAHAPIVLNDQVKIKLVKPNTVNTYSLSIDTLKIPKKLSIIPIGKNINDIVDIPAVDIKTQMKDPRIQVLGDYRIRVPINCKYNDESWLQQLKKCYPFVFVDTTASQIKVTLEPQTTGQYNFEYQTPYGSQLSTATGFSFEAGVQKLTYYLKNQDGIMKKNQINTYNNEFWSISNGYMPYTEAFNAHLEAKQRYDFVITVEDARTITNAATLTHLKITGPK